MATLDYRFKIRGGLAAALASLNEVPLRREMIVELDNLFTTGEFKAKIGDGTTHYNDLPYLETGSGSDIQAGVGIDIETGSDGSKIISAPGSDIQAGVGIDIETGSDGSKIISASGSSFDPLSLFSDATCGLWIDFTDLSTMFQDTAGTVPVTTTGQSIALIKDKSGFGFDASQATSSKRAKLTQDSDGVYGAVFTSGCYYNLGKATNGYPLLIAACAWTTSGALNRIIDNRGTGTPGTVKGCFMRGWSNQTDTLSFDNGSGAAMSQGVQPPTEKIVIAGYGARGLLILSQQHTNLNAVSATSFGSPVNTNNNTIGIAIDGSSQPFVGNIYQIYAVGGKSLSSAALDEIQAYLANACNA